MQSQQADQSLLPTAKESVMSLSVGLLLVSLNKRI